MPAEAPSRQARADAVRLERLRLRLDQKDIAEAAKLNQGTVSRAENGIGTDNVYEAIEDALQRFKAEKADA